MMIEQERVKLMTSLYSPESRGELENRFQQPSPLIFGWDALVPFPSNYHQNLLYVPRKNSHISHSELIVGI